MTMIKSLLIANRGEIACRVIRTARKLGIRTVAVYSDADANALHVRQADEAVHIGPSPTRESYLVGEKIIAAAKATGAEAIHPGYGFLSENAAFAQAVMDADLIWVGPNPSSITAMGLKDAAKQLMADAGVPVTPGYMGENQEPDFLAAEAGKIGYPVLIKAVAGGGGKGMRLVEAPADFTDALASCQREAASSFGNAHVLIEKYIQRPRHIEVQVFGDTHGNIVHLFERDCSLQRRHQKVIEEAPAPGMDEATREAVCTAAVNAAKAVDYVGAGTIEFIADGSEGLRADRIWFMEMNTRLQVEHPVTEEITGVDLVEWQLRVASGEPLPKRQDELSINGWAMEARLYAEDPAKGFLPSIGSLSELALPHWNVRVDTGVDNRSEVTPFYDPMIAKLIVHAPDRRSASDKLAHACGGVFTLPVQNNAGFLAALLRDEAFTTGNVTTDFIGARLDDLLQTGLPSSAVAATAASLLYREAGGSLASVDPQDFGDRGEGIWRDLIGFRLNRPAKSTMLLLADDELVEAEIGTVPNGNCGAGDRTTGHDGGIAIVERGWPHLFRLPRTDAAHGAGVGDGAILAPMPGMIIAVSVAAGDRVTKGQKLLTLEAMKMEHTLTAPFDGVVAELNAAAGGQVQVEALLARIEAQEEAA
jgi:3-methylcrotonyl-CoA carboxylase alpha subunit